MRIDDINFPDFPDFQEQSINIDNNIQDIDSLIKDIELTENTLRRRKGGKYQHIDNSSPKTSFKYITTPNLNDIDDVIIEIESPEEYYLNKERRIIAYKDHNTPIVTYKFLLSIITTILYMIKCVTILLIDKKIKMV